MARRKPLLWTRWRTGESPRSTATSWYPSASEHEVALVARTPTGSTAVPNATATVRRHPVGTATVALRWSRQATYRAGRATRSVTSARITVGVPNRLHTLLVTAAPASEVLQRTKPVAVAASETTIGRGTRATVKRTANSTGANTSPATSLSFPVTHEGHACLSHW